MNLPKWVLTEENYQPDGDRDYFISRSLLRIMKILRSIRYQSRRRQLEKFSAVGALSFVIMLIILCVSARTINFLICILALELITMCLLDGKTIRQILQNSLAMTIFSACFVLPSIFLGNINLIILLE